MNTTTQKNYRTNLNKAFRGNITVNGRRWKDGTPITMAKYIDSNGTKVVRYVDQKSENGGDMTPFNIQCNAVGACAVRSIIQDGDYTIVLFADGDKVSLKRHADDKNDPVTALLWALGQKVFGTGLVRQIHTALKNRTIDAAKLRLVKKASSEAVPQ